MAKSYYVVNARRGRSATHIMYTMSVSTLGVGALVFSILAGPDTRKRTLCGLIATRSVVELGEVVATDVRQRHTPWLDVGGAFTFLSSRSAVGWSCQPSLAQRYCALIRLGAPRTG
jgi:hypothetical protein